MSTSQNITIIVATATGLVGAVLGILNTWHQLSREKVCLRVVPKMAVQISPTDVLCIYTVIRRSEMFTNYARQGLPTMLCIEITNLSPFPVTISKAGFGRSKTDENRHTLYRPTVSPGHIWPARLEARQAVTLYALPDIRLNATSFREPVAFAETDCGEIAHGTSPALQEYFDDIQKDATR